MTKLSFSLSATIAIGLLTACGSSDEETQPTSGTPAPSSTSPTDPAPPTGSPTGGSSGSSGGAPASPCIAATRTLCERACACGTNGTCVVAYGPTASVTEEHDSLTDCENFYAFLVCGQADQAAAYGSDACASALSAAACTATKSKGGALAFPDACRAPK
jgi:hypothetical protein